MYVHLGNNYIISAQDIIAIINIEPPVAEDLEDIMQIAIDEKRIVYVGEGKKRKSLIICDDKVYISPISSTTLYKRIANCHKGV
ncbi:protein of unknown function [Thermosyntropha lipolytica DSM 11003]|uniref:DUF370 domain-containing protein n=1 Tax=Thermosyntropha lipolytica DSM 11003 TaxID=1123382 RepID=A0A1M5QPZ0_9FIRM|nr:DUF370 domain-containing protein [Thermosyntropha lipolytica]SHH16182.1 protein of unknown function [Thermosyntropha lipolytica DSM 11003]